MSKVATVQTREHVSKFRERWYEIEHLCHIVTPEPVQCWGSDYSTGEG